MCYLITCAFCGISWLSYFLFHMSFSRFVAGVSAMFSDGSHSDTFASKLRGLLAIFMIFFPYFLLRSLFICFMEIFKCYFKETICLFSYLNYIACSGTDFGLVLYAKTVELSRTPFLLFAFSCFPVLSSA